MNIRENQLLRSKNGQKEKDNDHERSFELHQGADQSAFTYKASLEITKDDFNDNQNDISN